MTTATATATTTTSIPQLDFNTRVNSLNDSTTINNIADNSDEGMATNEGVEVVVGNSQSTSNGFHPKSQKNIKMNGDSNNTTNTSSFDATNNGSSSNQRVTSDHGKRKKLKSRSSTVPVSELGYMKDHLDAWLETCLKDASNAQLSSSSEFLDFNPMNQINKNNFLMQQRGLHHQHQQQQQLQTQKNASQQSQQINQTLSNQKQSFQPIPFGQNFLPNKNQKFSLQQQQQQQQPCFSGLNSSASGTFPNQNGNSVPFCQGSQRSMMPNYMKYATTPAFNNRFSFNFPSSGAYLPLNNGSQDFASLPPIVNMMGTNVDSSEHDINSTDVLDGSGINPNISRGFRFSDPCLLNPSDEDDSKSSDQNLTKNQANGKQSNNMENNKFFAALMEQINLLHETNSKICKNLHETKVDIEALKHAPNWVGMRHRRDSLSGLSTHSQPMMFGGGFSSHSPAPTYHSGSYAPGMVSELVREVKDAARVREDALLNRVKSLVEERQWSLNESNLRIMRDIEELKSQIRQLRSERKESNKRISHLESENKYLRQMLATLFNNQHHQKNDIIYENAALRSRKNFANAKRSQSLNLHYGTLHQAGNSSCMSLEEELDEGLHIHETPSSISTADIATLALPCDDNEKRSSLSSTDSSLSTSGSVEHKPLTISNGTTSKPSTGTIPSPPNFALISSPEEISRNENPLKLPEKHKDKLEEKAAGKSPRKINPQELQKELKEAVIARTAADKRIIALEKRVRTLQINARHPVYQNGSNTTSSTNNLGVGSITNAKATAASNSNSISKGSPTKRSSANAPPPPLPAKTATSLKHNPLSNTTSNNNNNHKKLRHQVHHNHHSVSANGIAKTLSPSSSKLSVSGPITDL